MDSVPRFRSGLFPGLLFLFLLVLFAPGAAAQTTGSIVGRVVDARTQAPLEGVALEIVGTTVRGTTAADGRFVIGSVPPGERTLRVQLLGYRTLELEGVIVRTGQPQDVKDIPLDVAPVVIGAVTAQAERRRLVEPDISTTRDIIVSRELRELPVDRIEQVVEMTPGVSGGHFRGGRVGQEVHVVDGVELKNQFEASSQGNGLELSPTSLEEVEVITGGFGAQYGSALSGVVSYVTRRGSTERWQGRVSAATDQWAPASMFYGFTSLSLSGGGPLRFLGSSATLFADVLAQGMLDADPRARGLTCLQAEDAAPSLAGEITALRDVAPDLACPQAHTMLPHQRGDKLIMFTRFDRALGRSVNMSLTGLRNRTQRELYAPEFRYNESGQLGQRSIGSLVTLNLDWSQNAGSRAIQVAARTSFMRLDRYLGVVDGSTFSGTRVAGFGVSDFAFRGEDEARAPIEEQLASPRPLSGYVVPNGYEGNPYGIAGEGIFFTGGTPHIASWAKTDVLSMDLTNEVLWLTGSSLRSGISAKLYGVESYERTLAHLAGSSPNYARFYPATISGFTETRVAVSDEMTFNVGMRLDAFKSGINYRANRADILSDTIQPGWQVSFNPRLGVAMPVPGTNNGTAIRFNYSYVSQPPDFRYFLDTAVGDSLRTDIRRQGNPALSFERGKSFEIGVSTLIGENAGLSVTAFRKELSNLVSGNLRLSADGEPLYSTDDQGTVNGLELAARGRWNVWSMRASYALQKAIGVASGMDGDSVILGDRQLVAYPLTFDRRHSIDVALFYGRAAGAEMPWSAALTATAQSGYPINRLTIETGVGPASGYLPWTSTLDLRVTRELGSLPGCDDCGWRISADGRNLLGNENVLAVRRETGMVSPSLEAVMALANSVPAPAAGIPMESPLYTRAIDINRDGIITPAEFRTGRMAAALSRFDPSLYFGEPRQVRFGIEVTF